MLIFCVCDVLVRRLKQDKIVKVDETVAGKVPKIGAPLPVENGDEKMGLSRRGSGRIRKKKKKDVERAKKIRQRMLERSAMLM